MTLETIAPLSDDQTIKLPRGQPDTATKPAEEHRSWTAASQAAAGYLSTAVVIVNRR
jgi:hypothetical protein